MKKIVFSTSLFILMMSQGISQCMMKPILLSQRVSQSLLVIEGKVIDQKSFWDPLHQNIYTSNLIEVYKTFKNTPAPYIEVITEGGIVGNDKEVVEPSLQLAINDIGVFTINTNVLPSQFGKQVYDCYASAQGFIKYNVAEDVATETFKTYASLSTTLYNEVQLATGSTFTVIKPYNAFYIPTSLSVAAPAALTSFSPTTITAGTFSVLTINGSGFGAVQGTSFVEFKNADDGGATYIKPHASAYVSWSATQILVKVPSTNSTSNASAGTGLIRVDVGGVKSTSATNLTIQYNHINVYSAAAPPTIYNTRHINKQLGGYNWQMFTTFNSNALAKASFLRAFQTWRCGTYVNWTSTTTTTVNVAANDGINIIRFDIGTELPAGVLGRCTNRFSGCGVNPTQSWFVDELDIVFDDATTWNFGPAAPTLAQYDFESVAVHELGHGHELGHVINTLEIMNYSIANGQSKRVLSVNDLAGGNAVMARNASGTVCALSMMSPLTASNCVLGSPNANFTSNKTTVCVGQSVIFTNLSTGSPTATAWTFQGGTPGTSAVSNPTITYNTPGTYSVQLISTNSFGSSSYSVASYIKVLSPSTLPLLENFQSTFVPTNWAVNDIGNDGYKWELSTSAGQASTQSALFDNWSPGIDISGTRDELLTSVNLTGFLSAKMTFYRAYGLTYAAPNIDSLEVKISTNCGTTNTQAYLKGGSQISTGVGTGASVYVPLSTVWVKDSVDLTSYVGNSAVLISFVNRSWYGDGMYLDNINITGVMPIPPTASITSVNSGCVGQPITLTDASLGSPTSWTWNMPGGTPISATTQNTLVTYATPGVKTISLTVVSSTGTNTAVKTITISALPIITINTATVCSGIAATLTAGGASTYTWSTGPTTTSISVTPTVTTIYSVTATSTLGCVNSKTTTVTVNALPTITATSPSICVGASTVITAGGATSYTWSTGPTTFSISVTPITTTNYTVTGTNALGCVKSKTTSVTVNPLPSVSVISATICSGSTGTLIASGASTYLWNTGATGANLVASPLVNTNYTVTGTSTFGCVKTATGSIVVGTAAVISVNSPSICIGSTVALTASGVTTYTWNTGLNTSSITVSPIATTIYTVSGNLIGCVGITTKTTSVYVNALPVVTLGTITSPLCTNSPTVALVGAPASGTYSGTGVVGSIFNPSISGSGAFTVSYYYTDVNGCSNSASQPVNVSLCTGINETPNLEVSIYPNPAKDLIYITLATEEFNNTTIELYDAIGKLILVENVVNKTTLISLNNLTKGIYTVRVVSEKAHTMNRIIKE